MKLLALALTIAALTSHAYGQEHDHGQGNLPDWYDPSCCNQRDCRPVEDKDIVFEQFEGQWVARHIPTGNRFPRSMFKLSQDERYHICINTLSDTSLCFYDRPGA